MSNIKAMTVKIPVADLDTAIPLYQELAGTDAVTRFRYKDRELAAVGPFLLLSGPVNEPHAATVIVASLDAVETALERAGGEIVEPRSQVPNGTRLIARHPDGAVFEYIQPPA